MAADYLLDVEQTAETTQIITAKRWPQYNHTDEWTNEIIALARSFNALLIFPRKFALIKLFNANFLRPVKKKNNVRKRALGIRSTDYTSNRRDMSTI